MSHHHGFPYRPSWAGDREQPRSWQVWVGTTPDGRRVGAVVDSDQQERDALSEHPGEAWERGPALPPTGLDMSPAAQAARWESLIGRDALRPQDVCRARGLLRDGICPAVFVDPPAWDWDETDEDEEAA